MMEDELRKKIEEISASIGLDFEDENLSDEEKNALFRYALKEIDKEEYIRLCGKKKKWESFKIRIDIREQMFW